MAVVFAPFTLYKNKMLRVEITTVTATRTKVCGYQDFSACLVIKTLPFQ